MVSLPGTGKGKQKINVLGRPERIEDDPNWMMVGNEEDPGLGNNQKKILNKVND